MEVKSQCILASFPKANSEEIDTDLEARMEMAQKLSSMVLSLRRRESLKVRQPLGRIMVPVLDDAFKTQLQKIEELVLSEVNVKELEYLDGNSNVLVKNIKANFKKLGPKFGKNMKEIAGIISSFNQDSIAELEQKGEVSVDFSGGSETISLEDVEISSSDIPGWLVANEGRLTVALDITVTTELRNEGIAREMVNRIQNLRKDSGFEVTDTITVDIVSVNDLSQAVNSNLDYICAETLCDEIRWVEQLNDGLEVELDEEIKTSIRIMKN